MNNDDDKYVIVFGLETKFRINFICQIFMLIFRSMREMQFSIAYSSISIELMK